MLGPLRVCLAAFALPLLLGVLPVAAMSQTPAASGASDRGSTVEELVVRGERGGLLETDAEAAARMSRIAGGATLVDREAMETTRGATLADVTEFAPGLVAQARFGPEDLRLSVRGSGLNRTGHGRGLMLVMHGMPINAADGNFDAINFDLWSARRLEVYRGVQAARYGATTLGGVVEMIPRTGRSDPGMELDLTGGSFDFRRLRASYGAQHGDTDWFLAASGTQYDGFRDQAKARTAKLHANVGQRWSDRLESRLFLSAATTRSEWPGTLTRDQFDEDASQAAPIALARDLSNDIDHVIVSAATRLLHDDAESRLTLGFGRRDQDHPTPGAILVEPAETALIEVAHQREIGGGLLDVGARGAHSWTRPRRFAYAGPPPSDVSAERGALQSSRRQRAYNVDLFARYERPLGERWLATAGLTLTESERRDRPRGDLEQGAAYDRTYRSAAPSVGLVFLPDDRQQWFLGFSRGFEAPSFFDLDGNRPLQDDGVPRLSAQRSWTLEGGSRGQTERLRWEAVLFAARLDGEILRIDPFGAVNPPAVNADRTTRLGAELGLDAVLHDGASGRLVLRQRADFNRFRFDDDPVHGDNTVPGIAPWLYRGWLVYESAQGWYVGPMLHAGGSIDVDLVNETKAPSHAIFGLRAGLERERWSLRAEVTNLTDRDWVSTTNILNRAAPGSGILFPGDGRAFYLTWALTAQ